MKVPQCDWAPQLVVEWLSGELEERGIPGPTYAHTLLSLLHSQYCTHPPLSAGLSIPASTLSRRQHSRTNSRELNPKHLNLEDLLDDIPHPDADLPDLTPLTALKCGGSRRARKRFRVRQKHRIFTSEELQKVAALQCLMSASDEDLQHYDFENLIEELCTRLKLSKEGKNLSNSSETLKTTAKTNLSEESGQETDDSTPEELAQKYYAAFPPLGNSSKQGSSEDTVWKSSSCDCSQNGSSTLVGSLGKTILELTNGKRSEKSNKIKAKEIMFSKYPVIPNQWESRSLPNNMGDNGILHEIKQTQECPEVVFDERFVATSQLIQEEIPEGYVGDTSSRESSEDRDKIINPGKNYTNDMSAVKKVNFEEWERANDAIAGAKMPTCRLFERCSISGGTSGCSSDIETRRTTPVVDNTEEASMKLLEKIANSVPQVWGQQNSLNSMEYIWNPPFIQDNPPAIKDHLATYSLGDVFMSRPTSPENTEHNDFTQTFNSVQFAEDANCPMTGSVFLNPIIDQKAEPIFSSAFGSNPISAMNPNEEHKTNMFHWPDYNANETVIGTKLPTIGTNRSRRTSEKLPGAEDDGLCSSFQQLGLEQLRNRPITNILNTSGSNSSMIKDPPNIIANDFSITDSVIFDEELDDRVHLEMDTLRPIPSGPSGPHPVLKHTESSGFTTVVPRKSAELFPADSLVLELSKSNSTSSSSIPATFNQDPTNELAIPVTEEENLLTSPRTHFKPIRQDSKDKNSENTGEEQIIASGFQHPQLSFQRTGSGALFLESDLLEGSPKKYMIYREPSCKNLPDAVESPQPKETIGSVPLVPKFKVVNNEKFSQTEREQNTKISYEDIRDFKNKNNNAKNSLGENYQPNSFLGLSDIWKNTSEDVDKLENIWKSSSNEPWPCHSLPNNGEPNPIFGNAKWSATSGIYDSIKDTNPVSSVGVNIPKTSNWSFNDDTSSFNAHSFNPNTSIWGSGIKEKNATAIGCDNTDKRNYVSLGGCFDSNTWKDKKDEDKIADLWKWQSQKNTDRPEDIFSNTLLNFGGAIKKNIHVNPEEIIGHSVGHNENPNKCSIEEFGHPSSIWSTSAAMNPEQSLEEKRFEHNIWELSKSKEDYCKNTMNNGMRGGQVWNLPKMEAEILDRDPKATETASQWDVPKMEANNPEACNAYCSSRTLWDLPRMEDDFPKDQMKDKELGYKSYKDLWDVPKMEAKVPDGLIENKNDFNGSNYPWILPSIKNVSEEAKNKSSNSRLEEKCDAPEFYPFLWRMHQEQKENADPEPNFQQEFESLSIEDLDHLAPGWEFNDGFEWDQHQDDNESEDGDCEVLILEADDGSTIQVPVEYLDDSFYDEIFGSADKPIGGSMPDLPSGDSLQVQIPKKTKGGKWLPPSRRPCSFFMEGNCKRPDCKFSHDLASITCRRRQRNKSEGSECETEVARNIESFIRSSGFELNSEADFPSLSSSVESKRTATPDESMIQSMNGNTVITNGKSKKKSKFIRITRNLIGDVKSSERTCRFIRHRAARRQQRKLRPNPESSDQQKREEKDNACADKSGSNAKKPIPATLKRLGRHRATASGHEDGTVSDY